MKPRPYILIVEDDDVLRKLFVEALTREGREVIAVRSGAAAITVLRSTEAPSLVLCDLVLPELDGNGVIAECQIDPRLAATPIVVVTGFPQRAPAGVRVLVKPVAMEVLLDVVRECCDGEKPKAGG